MKYIGTELYLFEKAQNWKKYWSSMISLHMSGDVLEVGAGIGTNTKFFANADFKKWVCLEPDLELLEEARKRNPGNRYEFIAGTIADVKDSFDVIFYIDVLEHIKDDAAEMKRAADHLKSNGTLIVLVPAHQWLFSPLDTAVGHYRRYTKRSLIAAVPSALELERLVYLDSMGLFASLTNKLLLRQKMPSLAQIHTWDSFLVPVSKILDPLLGHTIGKSVLGVWRRS